MQFVFMKDNSKKDNADTHKSFTTYLLITEKNLKVLEIS